MHQVTLESLYKLMYDAYIHELYRSMGESDSGKYETAWNELSQLLEGGYVNAINRSAITSGAFSVSCLDIDFILIALKGFSAIQKTTAEDGRIEVKTAFIIPGQHPDHTDWSVSNKTITFEGEGKVLIL